NWEPGVPIHNGSTVSDATHLISLCPTFEPIRDSNVCLAKPKQANPIMRACGCQVTCYRLSCYRLPLASLSDHPYPLGVLGPRRQQGIMAGGLLDIYNAGVSKLPGHSGS